MFEARCPVCGDRLEQSEVNVAQDVYYCAQCQTTGRLSDVARGAGQTLKKRFKSPPAGTWVRQTGGGFVAGARVFTVSALLTVLFIALFWNGILGVFVYAFVRSLFVVNGWPLPPLLQFEVKSNFDTSPGGLVFLGLFLTPFVLIGLVLVFGVFYVVFGSKQVEVDRGRLIVRLCYGPLRFDVMRLELADVVAVQMAESLSYDRKSAPSHELQVRDKLGSVHRIGSGLPVERLQFLAQMIRDAVAATHTSRGGQIFS